ncbi:MAG: hypothetical protein ACYTF1_26815, partial [Planctomycetota bacterium]
MRVIRSIIFLFLLSSATFTANDYFSLGSSPRDVRNIQGKPDSIMNGPFMGDKTWVYDHSTVTISLFGDV